MILLGETFLLTTDEPIKPMLGQSKKLFKNNLLEKQMENNT
jgi:hypothetical protein